MIYAISLLTLYFIVFKQYCCTAVLCPNKNIDILVAYTQYLEKTKVFCWVIIIKMYQIITRSDLIVTAKMTDKDLKCKVHTRIHWLAFLSTALLGGSEYSPHRHPSRSPLLVSASNTPPHNTLYATIITIFITRVCFGVVKSTSDWVQVVQKLHSPDAVI